MFKEEMKMKSFSYTVKERVGNPCKTGRDACKGSEKFPEQSNTWKRWKICRCFPTDGSYGNGSQKNQTVTVKVEGDDEGAACDAIKAFFETNL